MFKKVLFLSALWGASFAFSQDFDIKIWDGVKMPGDVFERISEKQPDGRNKNTDVKMSYEDAIKKFGEKPNKSSGQYGMPNEGFQRVVEPALRCYKAKTESKKPAPAIIICPGGGYAHLAYGKEGTDIAKFLSEGGTTCFILAYRIPGNNRECALMDIQRAIRLVRKNAKKWNVDPEKIGVMGFSAGGHLSANASTNYNRQTYAPLDSADRLSAKPNFTVLIYPAYLADRKTLALSPEIKVDKDTPMAFIAQTQGDFHYEMSSVGYMLALRAAGVPVDFHYFHDGEHGYGLNEKKRPVKDWGELLKTWLKANKLAL